MVYLKRKLTTDYYTNLRIFQIFDVFKGIILIIDINNLYINFIK